LIGEVFVTTRRTYRHTTEEEDEYDEVGAATVAVVATRARLIETPAAGG
jgi:hypothetical protein